MAFDAEEGAADEDTVAISSEEVTQANEDWPIAEFYRVEPDVETVTATSDQTTDDTVMMAQSSAPAAARRRLPPVGSGLLVAIASGIGAVILVAVLLGLRDGDETVTARPPTTSNSAPTSAGNQTTPASTPASNASVVAQDLEGTSLEEARLVLEKEGLRISVREQGSDRPRGEILSQAPPPGTKLKRNAVITLVVSKGEAAPAAPTRVRVPSAIGLRASAAIVAIRDVGLEVRIRLVTSSEPAGTVIRQSPAEGTEAVRGTEIVLAVAKSRRPVVQRVEVPDVVGTTVEAAQGVLRSAGFAVTVVSVSSEEPAGQVVEQSPSAGEGLRKGATVTVRVSSGTALVDVPDVTGLDEQSARLELENAGFTVRLMNESTLNPAEDGVVVGQTPLGGSRADEGGLVTLTVARLG